MSLLTPWIPFFAKGGGRSGKEGIKRFRRDITMIWRKHWEMVWYRCLIILNSFNSFIPCSMLWWTLSRSTHTPFPEKYISADVAGAPVPSHLSALRGNSSFPFPAGSITWHQIPPALFKRAGCVLQWPPAAYAVYMSHSLWPLILILKFQAVAFLSIQTHFQIPSVNLCHLPSPLDFLAFSTQMLLSCLRMFFHTFVHLLPSFFPSVLCVLLDRRHNTWIYTI